MAEHSGKAIRERILAAAEQAGPFRRGGDGLDMAFDSIEVRHVGGGMVALTFRHEGRPVMTLTEKANNTDRPWRLRLDGKIPLKVV